MQALYGDAPAKDNGDKKSIATAILREIEGVALALQQLKIAAWRSEHGKKQDKAMIDYVDLVASIAPQWRVATMLAAHESTKDDRPRQMVWVLNVKFKEVGIKGEKATQRRSVAEGGSLHVWRKSRTSTNSLRRLLAKSIEILQWSDDSNTRFWVEETVAKTAPSAVLDKIGAFSDPFLIGMPADLIMQDCIVDKAKHKTMQEQRKYYQELMLEMQEDEGGGWELYGKTAAPEGANSKQLEIHQRSVKWSSAKQLRTVLKTELTTKEVFAEMVREWKIVERNRLEKLARGKSESLRKAASQTFYPFHSTGESSATAIEYRILVFPWPLSSRDYFIVQDYVYRNEGQNPYFFTYNHGK